MNKRQRKKVLSRIRQGRRLTWRQRDAHIEGKFNAWLHYQLPPELLRAEFESLDNPWLKVLKKIPDWVGAGITFPFIAPLAPDYGPNWRGQYHPVPSSEK